VKKRLLGSRYGMEFGSGVDFNMDVVTSDSGHSGNALGSVESGRNLQENDRNCD